jgi:hypothetical protein
MRSVVKRIDSAYSGAAPADFQAEPAERKVLADTQEGGTDVFDVDSSEVTVDADARRANPTVGQSPPSTFKVESAETSIEPD